MGFGCGVLAGFGWLCGASPGFAFTFAFLAWTGLLGCWAGLSLRRLKDNSKLLKLQVEAKFTQFLFILFLRVKGLGLKGLGFRAYGFKGLRICFTGPLFQGLRVDGLRA